MHLARAVRWLSVEERDLLAARNRDDAASWVRVETTALYHIPSELSELIDAFDNVKHPILKQARHLLALARERGMEMLLHSQMGGELPQDLKVKVVDEITTGIEVLLGRLDETEAIPTQKAAS